MKKQIAFMGSLVALFALGGCSKSSSPLDYSKEENWYCLGKGGTKEVDTVFIYPTVVMKGELVTTVEENRQGVIGSKIHEVQASVFDEHTNLYMPFYRQTAMSAVTGNSPLGICNLFSSYQGYKDLEASLDYYFANFNNNKPFILAGHSQGSAQIYNLLTKYMQNHQEYLSRMVAAYPIGFGMSKTEIAKYSNLKFATGEEDTNCIISYNTFASAHTGPSLLHDSDSYVINPINWKTDDTYASVESNLGSLIGGEHVAGVSDAKVDVANGYLVSSADSKYEVKGVDALFGTHSFHTYDYGFYYNNLVENVGKRVAAFLKK